MKVLGLSAFERDSAAALIVDGQVVGAAQEERFSRKRGDRDFPRRAVQACLDASGLTPADLDRVVFYERPLRKFERVLVSQLRGFPHSAGSFSRTMFAWFGERLWVKNQIAEYLGVDRGRVAFTDTALAHAAGAFQGSGFEQAAVLVLDDVGEWSTTWLGRGDAEGLHPLGEQRFPHSLGLFASAIAQYLGFEPGADEHLVESLARLGSPSLRAKLEQFCGSDAEASFEVDVEAFRFAFDDRLWFSKKFAESLGPERHPGGEVEAEPGRSRHADIAASAQAILEERALGIAAKLHAQTGLDRLALGGALAANRSLVTRLGLDGPFERVHVAGSPDKSGAALGAAWIGAGSGTHPSRSYVELRTGLGLGLDDPEHTFDTDEARSADVADNLRSGHTIALLADSLPFGDDLLGRRLTLVSPHLEDAPDRLRRALGQPEPHRPVTLLVPHGRLAEWFPTPRPLDPGFWLLEPAGSFAQEITSAIGRDGRVRVGAVPTDSGGPLAGLFEELARRDRTEAVLSMPFALRGSPLVRTEQDALDAFTRTSIDVLVCGNRRWRNS